MVINIVIPSSRTSCWLFHFIAGRPKAALLFWFFGDFRCGALILDVARCYLWLFSLYINIQISKIVVKC